MIRSDENSTVIDKMLMLVNRFGLSHVCALKEFENIGTQVVSLSYN